MRNLTFIATAGTHSLAKEFRRSFMEKTAVWNVLVEPCQTMGEAKSLFQADRTQAFAASYPFRSLMFGEGKLQGASARLTQGADVLYRGERGALAISQLSRSAVDLIERTFLPLYGSNVVVLGSGSAALDLAYELSRAGVSQITLLGNNKEQARAGIVSFLECFDKQKSQIIDTDQAREGHLSATRAYENARFQCGTVASVSRIQQADVVFSVDADLSGTEFPLRPGQIACSLWDRSDLAFPQAALAAGCDFVSAEEVMRAWGADCAELLVEFSGNGF